MFGYLRFLLAIIVLFSHTGLSPEWGNLGATSVTIFYMLSGFVITNILNKLDKRGDCLIINFYIDRFLRIFPLYIISLCFYYLYIIIKNADLTTLSLLQNLTLIPCNYIKNPTIPVAWSLALEFQVFLIMPIIYRNKVLFYSLGLISMIIFLASNLSYLNKYTWAYFKLPGVLFIFLTGSIIAQSKVNIIKSYLAIFIALISLSGFFFVEFGFIERGGFQSEVLLGIFLGVLLIIQIKDSRRLKFNQELGSMSYSIFLIHFLFIFIFGDYNLNSYFFNLCVFSSSLIFSILAYYLMERKLNNWRINLN